MSTTTDDCVKFETQNVIAQEESPPQAYFHDEAAPFPLFSNIKPNAEGADTVHASISPMQVQIVGEVAALLQQCADANTRQIKATAIAAIICALLCFGVLHLTLTAVTHNQTRVASERVLSKTSPLDSFAKMDDPAHDEDQTSLQNTNELASPTNNSTFEQFLRWHNEHDKDQK